jgi:hypothetical protein
MALTERIEIRLSLAEKTAIERSARRGGMSVSDYVRACCHRDYMAEVDPEAIKRLYQAKAEQLIELNASLRAATLKTAEQQETVARVTRAARTKSKDR